MLSTEGRTEFEERGYTRLEGVFSSEAAEAMQAKVWASLERSFGVRRDDRATWALPHATGLRGLKPHRVFEPIGGTALTGALDTLLGTGRWRPPKEWGQFLVSFPVPGDEWTVPDRVWHTDFGFHLPPGRPYGALVFSFLADVPAGAGGTLIIAGSHRLVRRYLQANPRAPRQKMKFVRQALMRSHPWLAELSTPGGSDDRVARFMESDQDIDGIPVRVVELSGRAGDVVLGQPWLLHASSPHRGDQPRFMRVQRVHVPLEGEAAAGWKAGPDPARRRPGPPLLHPDRCRDHALPSGARTPPTHRQRPLGRAGRGSPC